MRAKLQEVGPPFAKSPSVAETLFKGLSDRASGAPIYLDVPENNVSARALASKYYMKEVLGCARMQVGRFRVTVEYYP